VQPEFSLNNQQRFLKNALFLRAQIRPGKHRIAWWQASETHTVKFADNIRYDARSKRYW